MAKKKKEKKNPYILPLSILLVSSLFLLFIFFVLNSQKKEAIPLPYPELRYTEVNEVKDSVPAPLEILPSNFLEIVEKNQLEISYKNRVELLNYGITTVENKKNEDYQKILDRITSSNSPLLVNNQSLLLYYKSEIKNLVEETTIKTLDQKLSKELLTTEIKLRVLKNFPFVDKETINTTVSKIGICNQLLKKFNYTECITSLSSMNTKEKDILEKIVKNKLDSIDRLNQIIGLENIFEKNKLKSDKTPFNLDFLDENDLEVLKNTKLTEKQGSNNLANNSEIFTDIDPRFLQRLIDTSKFLGASFEYDNVQSQALTRLIQNLEFIQKYTSSHKQGESVSTQQVLDILSSINTFSDSQKILLQTVKYKERLILTISPYIEIKRQIPVINDQNFALEYDTYVIPQPSNTVRLPVLMYHIIAPLPVGASEFTQGLHVDPIDFEKQIAYLTRKNYKTVTSEEFANILASGANPTQKTVMLTFDDGTPTHYSQAYPILKKYGQTGVFFVISSKTLLSHQQIKEMSDNGMDIQSHSKSHPSFPGSSNDLLTEEIAGSKAILQSITGKPVKSIAYPFCVADNRAFDIVSANGYLTGFSCGRFIDFYPSHRYYLSRVHVYTQMDKFIKLLSGIN